MFNRLVVSGEKGIKTHKPWTVAVSAMLQVVAVIALILVPLIYTEALDPRLTAITLVAPPPPQPPAPPTVVRTERRGRVPLRKFMAPAFIPNRIVTVTDEPPISFSAGDTDIPGGTNNIMSDILTTTTPPPPKPVPTQRIRLGGNVEAGALINNVTPEYPKMLQAAGISGTVVLHATIAKDGSIEQLEYVSGPPMLMKSAMDAVKQWRYKPYLLDDDPVEVETTINVDFKIAR